MKHFQCHRSAHWFAYVTTTMRLLLLLILAIFSFVSSFSVETPKLVMIGRAPALEKRASSALYVAPNNGRSSSTARDSAIHVEWEPVPELQRRIEDGAHYEHWHEYHGTEGNSHTEAVGDDGGAEEAVTCVKGVFFGYRVTPEERSRLKSADPNEPDATYEI